MDEFESIKKSVMGHYKLLNFSPLLSLYENSNKSVDIYGVRNDY
jgi:hypothetical protein